MPWMVSQRLCAVPDGGADDVAAAHGVADEVVVDAVAAEHALLAEMAKLGVADRAGGMAMVHGMAAHAAGVGRLDHDIAAQVGHLAAELRAVGRVLEIERRIQCQRGVTEGADDPFLGLLAAGVVGIQRPGHDDPVARLPAGHGLGERDGGVALLRGGAELDPGAAQPGAVEIHPAAAANDGGARLLVHAFEIHQPDRGRMVGVNGFGGQAHFESRPFRPGIGRRQVGLAIEAFLAVHFAGSDLDEANVQAGVLVGSEGESAGDVNAADRLLGANIVDDAMPGTNLDTRSGSRRFASFPRTRLRPEPTPCRANHRRQRLGTQASSRDQNQSNWQDCSHEVGHRKVCFSTNRLRER